MQTNSDLVSGEIKFPATKIVYWPSGPVASCDGHAKALVGLAAMLGSHVGVTVAPDGSECVNCRNEAAKAGTNN